MRKREPKATSNEPRAETSETGRGGEREKRDKKRERPLERPQRREQWRKSECVCGWVWVRERRRGCESERVREIKRRSTRTVQCETYAELNPNSHLSVVDRTESFHCSFCPGALVGVPTEVI
jgi:hypothetical protein